MILPAAPDEVAIALEPEHAEPLALRRQGLLPIKGHEVERGRVFT